MATASVYCETHNEKPVRLRLSGPDVIETFQAVA